MAVKTSRLKLFDELEIGSTFWWRDLRWKKVDADEDSVGRYNAETPDRRHRWYFAWWEYVTVSSGFGAETES